MNKNSKTQISTAIAFACTLLNTFASAPARAESAQSQLADIKRLSPQLKDKKTRMAAMEKLLPMASAEIYKSGSVFMMLSPEQKEVQTKSYDALQPYLHDPDSLQMGLQSENDELKNWALTYVRSEIKGRWIIPARLISAVHYVAITGEPDYRRRALLYLRDTPGQENFVAERVKQENSAWVLSEFIHSDSLFNRKLVGLLSSEDEKVRADALSYIAANGGSLARTYWRAFDLRTLLAVTRLSKSPIVNERLATVSALKNLWENKYHIAEKTMATLLTDPALVPLLTDPTAAKCSSKSRSAGSIEENSPIEHREDGPIDPIDKLQLLLAKDTAEMMTTSMDKTSREKNEELQDIGRGAKPIPKASESSVCALGFISYDDKNNTEIADNGQCTVEIDYTANPIILVLMGEHKRDTVWNLKVAANVQIEKIIVSGTGKQVVNGAPKSAQITDLASPHDNWFFACDFIGLDVMKPVYKNTGKWIATMEGVRHKSGAPDPLFILSERNERFRSQMILARYFPTENYFLKETGQFK